MTTHSQRALILYRRRRFINHLLTYLLTFQNRKTSDILWRCLYCYSMKQFHKVYATYSGELNATIFRHSNTQLQCSPYRSCHTDTITNTLNKDRQERTEVLGSMQGWHGDPRGRTLWRGEPKSLGTLCVTFYLKCRSRAPKCPNFSERSKNVS